MIRLRHVINDDDEGILYEQNVLRGTCFERTCKGHVKSFNETVVSSQVPAMLFGAMSMYDLCLDSNLRAEIRPETSSMIHTPTTL